MALRDISQFAPAHAGNESEQPEQVSDRFPPFCERERVLEYCDSRGRRRKVSFVRRPLLCLESEILTQLAAVS